MTSRTFSFHEYKNSTNTLSINEKLYPEDVCNQSQTQPQNFTVLENYQQNYKQKV